MSFAKNYSIKQSKVVDANYQAVAASEAFDADEEIKDTPF